MLGRWTRNGHRRGHRGLCGLSMTVRWPLGDRGELPGQQEPDGAGQGWLRTWTSWYRRITLAMLTCAFLAVTAAIGHIRQPAPPRQILLTRSELAQRLTALATNRIAIPDSAELSSSVA